MNKENTVIENVEILPVVREEESDQLPDIELIAKNEGVELLQWTPQTIIEANREMFQDRTNTVYVSFKDPTTKQNKARIFNALNTADNPISNYVGQTLEIVDLIHHKYETIDTETGEIQLKYRNIIIDTHGNLFNTISYGINTALRSLFSIYGLPSEWSEPIKVKVIRGDNNSFKLELVTN